MLNKRSSFAVVVGVTNHEREATAAFVRGLQGRLSDAREAAAAPVKKAAEASAKNVVLWTAIKAAHEAELEAEAEAEVKAMLVFRLSQLAAAKRRRDEAIVADECEPDEFAA